MHTITVNPQVAMPTMSVANITMSLRTFRNGSADALATVTVRDNSGNLLPGAIVSGTWSGAVSGSATATANPSGDASFRSKRVRVPAGSLYTFTVTGITLSGYTYNAGQNAETSDSVAR